jgi:hypothetical protein
MEVMLVLAADGLAYDNFGSSVSISKDASQIGVGAYFQDYNSTITNSGAAYLFRESIPTKKSHQRRRWNGHQWYRATNDKIGSSIAIANNTCVVGASGDDAAKGSVFVVQTPSVPSAQISKQSLCFSAVNTVFVKEKGSIPMHDLEVGDFVQTDHHEGSLSRVLSFMHIDRDAPVEYLQIYVENMEKPFEVSHGHLLIKGATKITAVRAQDIKVGDILSGNKVIQISTVQRRGLYAPVTESGTILVSGVTATCYVDIMSSGMIPTTIQTHASHAALTPLRIMCAWKFSLCENESYSEDGFSSNLLAMTQFGLLVATWNGVLQWLVVIVFSPVLIGLSVLETLVIRCWLFTNTMCSTVVAAGVLYLCVGKMRARQWNFVLDKA